MNWEIADLPGVLIESGSGRGVRVIGFLDVSDFSGDFVERIVCYIEHGSGEDFREVHMNIMSRFRETYRDFNVLDRGK